MALRLPNAKETVQYGFVVIASKVALAALTPLAISITHTPLTSDQQTAIAGVLAYGAVWALKGMGVSTEGAPVDPSVLDSLVSRVLGALTSNLQVGTLVHNYTIEAPAAPTPTSTPPSVPAVATDPAQEVTHGQ